MYTKMTKLITHIEARLSKCISSWDHGRTHTTRHGHQPRHHHTHHIRAPNHTRNTTTNNIQNPGRI